jgi:hypothetical protein
VCVGPRREKAAEGRHCESNLPLGFFAVVIQINAGGLVPRRYHGSFPGSAWERIVLEALASRVHKLTMHLGEAEPRLRCVTRQSLVPCPP